MEKEKHSGKIALVIGATGVVGGRLVDELLLDKRYDTVWVLIRRTTAKAHPKLKEVILDFNELEDYYPKLFIDDVYCAIGTTIKQAKSQNAMYHIDVEYPVTVARLAVKYGVNHFTVISAVGANANSMIFYSRMKGELEQQLLSVNLPKLSIIRPPLLLDTREKARFAETLSSVISKKIQGIVTPTIRPKLGVYAMAVAKAMRTATTIDSQRVNIYEAQEIEKLAKLTTR
ncbi:MAG: NAD-dependent epimerase/dehydratase family protein [Kurthia sp.]|nr:NAD-dependent epimerase/dehydratase family protein [Candidatus Kurthia equi]